jgi:hypothetical protein
MNHVDPSPLHGPHDNLTTLSDNIRTMIKAIPRPLPPARFFHLALPAFLHPGKIVFTGAQTTLTVCVFQVTANFTK